MNEIGGYIELPQFDGDIFHSNAIALNSARNCLAYLIEARKIKKIAIPKFLCNSISEVCRKYDVEMRYYSIDADFKTSENFKLEKYEWFYFVNYYGQFNNKQISNLKEKHDRIIVDNVQAYFQKPIAGVDTIYTCRKFFGVPDGAFLYTNKKINRELEVDISFKRMNHLLGRFEENANQHYCEYTKNEYSFIELPIRKMSRLTRNILRAVDYEQVRLIREQNFQYLDSKLGMYNKLKIHVPIGSFMYPLYIPNGAEIRKNLQKEKIYVPTLWPDVLELCDEKELEYDLAKNILPIPCDQRYTLKDMEYVVTKVRKNLNWNNSRNISKERDVLND